VTFCVLGSRKKRERKKNELSICGRRLACRSLAHSSGSSASSWCVAKRDCGTRASRFGSFSDHFEVRSFVELWRFWCSVSIGLSSLILLNHRGSGERMIANSPVILAGFHRIVGPFVDWIRSLFGKEEYSASQEINHPVGLISAFLHSVLWEINLICSLQLQQRFPLMR